MIYRENIAECTCTNLGGRAYYTPEAPAVVHLSLPGYQPAQHATVLNPEGSCGTMVSVCVSRHRKNTIRTQCKQFLKMAPLYRALATKGADRRELAGLGVVRSQSVSQW